MLLLLLLLLQGWECSACMWGLFIFTPYCYPFPSIHCPMTLY